MNINDFSRLYRRKVSDLSDGSATFRLELGRVGAQKLRVLSHVTVENQTHDYVSCRLGICNVGVDHYLDELVTIAAAELAVSRSDILLGEGDVFFAELTGTTLDDVLIMSCIGWDLDL